MSQQLAHGQVVLAAAAGLMPTAAILLVTCIMHTKLPRIQTLNEAAHPKQRLCAQQFSKASVASADKGKVPAAATGAATMHCRGVAATAARLPPPLHSCLTT